MRLYFVYYGYSWIFMDKIYMVNAEGKRLIYTPTSAQNDRAVASGYVIEACDIGITKDQAIELKKFMSSKKVRVRYQGKGAYNFTLSDKHKKAFIETINYYL